MKAFVAENMQILDLNTKRTILQTVMLEADGAGILTLAKPDEDVVINLDDCGEANPDVVRSIYNTVLARRRVLTQPALPNGGVGSAGRGTDPPPAAPSAARGTAA